MQKMLWLTGPVQQCFQFHLFACKLNDFTVSLLVRVQTCTATLEIGTAVVKKYRNNLPQDPALHLEHTPEVEFHRLLEKNTIY